MSVQGQTDVEGKEACGSEEDFLIPVSIKHQVRGRQVELDPSGPEFSRVNLPLLVAMGTAQANKIE